jgi:hypothetical protein
MRYADWQMRFWREMDRQRTMPFVWGERDCVLFAATMGDAISDAEYVRRARSAFAWTNVREAAALLATGVLRAHVETVMGAMLPRQKLGMGDFVLVLDDKGWQSLAVHDGSQFIGKTESGVQRIPFPYLQGGWAVT